jgi:glycosyltransferase involved in cell wall biosynthesis
MTVITSTVLRSRLREAFDVVHLDTSDHRPVSRVGRVDVQNVALGVMSAIRLLRDAVRGHVDAIYLPIAKNRVGFLRDAVLLLEARALRRIVIVHFHARGFDEFVAAEAWWMRRLVRLALRTPRTHLIVLGTSLSGEFEGLIPHDRIHVVANGVEDQRVDAAPPASVPTVLHLSTLWSAKGVFEVLESAERLRARIPGIRYQLAGAWYSDDERKRAMGLVAREHLTRDVQFLGRVEPSERRRLLAAATVMAFPSHSEGHPLVALEALSAGLPVVATRTGAIPEMITDGREGFLVDVGDVDGLTCRIEEILTDPELRRRLSANARSRYERDFTADRFTDRLGDVWQRALHRPSLHRSSQTAAMTADARLP